MTNCEKVTWSNIADGKDLKKEGLVMRRNRDSEIQCLQDTL